MDTFQRRLEIIRILVLSREKSMVALSACFGVTTRTIQNDISYLSLFFPITTTRGRNGCVKVLDDYHPFAKILSFEQKNILSTMLVRYKLTEEERNVIQMILDEM